MQDSPLAPRPAWLAGALNAIGRHRFLTARQLAAVVDVVASDVAAVLDALVVERILVRLHPTRMLDGPEPDAAFALTRRGAALVASATGARPAVANTKRSMYMLAHELAVNDLAIVFEVLHAKRRLRLLRWETTREKIACHAHVRDRGSLRRVPLVADALAVLDVGGRTSTLLVEVDRNTLGIPRMRTKYAGYHAWWREDGPLQRFGTKSLRVLTLAPTPGRVERLRACAIDATEGRASGLFWFGEQAVANVALPARILDAAFTPAKREDATRQALFATTAVPAADA